MHNYYLSGIVLNPNAIKVVLSQLRSRQEQDRDSFETAYFSPVNIYPMIGDF